MVGGTDLNRRTGRFAMTWGDENLVVETLIINGKARK